MRRASAILLLLSTAFGLVSPLLAARTASELPECCRRTGSHRCAMTRSDASDAPGITAAKCSMYPAAKDPSTAAKTGTFTPVGAVITLVSGLTAKVEQTEAGYRISLGRSCLKRGPPSIS
ncbi:MAG: hypothetical protein LC126_09190 [Bryobacterales bacterium]|nr:hypothetical protein [Bryobacterales bacterium]